MTTVATPDRMNRDEILSMAREAGIEVHPGKQQARVGFDTLIGCDSTPKLTRFAELVAAKGRTARQQNQAMAECLDMLRDDLISSGVIGPDVAPMFLTEAVMAAIAKERTARQAAQRQLADLQELLAKSGLAERRAVQEAVREAVAAEREACALIAADSDHVVDVPGWHSQLGDAVATARQIEAAIRARGSQ